MHKFLSILPPNLPGHHKRCIKHKKWTVPCLLLDISVTRFVFCILIAFNILTTYCFSIFFRHLAASVWCSGRFSRRYSSQGSVIRRPLPIACRTVAGARYSRSKMSVCCSSTDCKGCSEAAERFPTGYNILFIYVENGKLMCFWQSFILGPGILGYNRCS
jgi:hypothetical protein